MQRTASSAGIFLTTGTLVAFLGFGDGGYDLLTWGEMGIVIWWALLLAALVGLARLGGLERTAWVALAALGGLTVWAALSLSWAESAERGVTELARLVTYLGIFAAGQVAARAGYGRALLGGVALGLAVIGAVALLSRLHPAWFPVPKGAELLAERNRLDYPLNYFNGLAALLALGITVLAGLAVGAREHVFRALAAAAIPALALALYFTISRGGLIAVAAGLLVLLAVVRNRLPKLASLLVVTAGSAVLVAAASGRQALEDGLRTAIARDQGDDLLLLTVLVCIVVGLLAPLAARLVGSVTNDWRPRPRFARVLAVGLVVAAAVVFVSAGGAAAVSDGWREFREPAIEAPVDQPTARLTSASGQGRYQIWRTALDAAEANPLHGIGTGGFEYWWARHGRIDGFIRNAHSLYFEALAELGIVGLALVLVLFGAILTGGLRRATRGPDPTLGAIAAAGCTSFAISAAIEWIWQLPVLPCAFLLLAAAAVAGRPPGDSSDRPGWPARLPLVAAAIVALLVLVPPVLSTADLRASEEAVAAGRLREALTEARNAEAAQPYAGSPKLQQALIVERTGDFDAAAALAREAARAERPNWRAWLVLSRLEARRGRAGASLAAYRRARRLNPRSVLFKR